MNTLRENMKRFGTKNLQEQSISNLPTNNPTPFDLTKINLGRELKKSGYKSIDNKGNEASWKIQDIKTIAKTNLLMVWSSTAENSAAEAIRKVFKSSSISYYQPNSDQNGLVPIFKLYRDDPNVPNKAGTLTINSKGFEELLVLKELNKKFTALLIKPYKVIKSKYDPMQDINSAEYKAKYNTKDEDDTFITK